MRYTAKFSDGFIAKTHRNLVYTHAWRSTGHLKSGKPWAMHGFSTVSAENARRGMHSDTRHLPGTGATIEFSEVVAVTDVEQVPA